MVATAMAASASPADAVKAADKPMSPHADASDDELGDEDQEPVEELPIRAEPMAQLGAAPADVERALRLIERCRLKGADDAEDVRKIVKEGAPAGFITTSGWTPVAAAAIAGNNNILLYLLYLGADAMYVTARRSVGDNNAGNGGDSDAPPSSPLLSRRTSAVGGGNATSDNALGFQAAAGGNSLNTPLHWASYAGHIDTVALLLQAGYSLEDRDTDGNQSLHLAAAGAHREVLELLLANAAPADVRNRYGNCAEDLATAPDCRKLLARFRAQQTCQWCKETFSRIRRPSLCQRCTNVYCDTKPCSSTTSVHIAELALTAPSSGGGPGFVPKRSLRFCQECATDMRKAEQDLRSVLETKQTLIQQVLDLLVDKGRPSTKHLSVDALPLDEEGAISGEVTTGEEGSDAPTVDTSALPQEAESGDSNENASDGVAKSEVEQQEPQPAPPGSSRSPLLTTDAAVLRALTLTHTDAESLYTALETAHAKAAAALDAALLEDARRTYYKLVAHIALQEEIKGLMLVRPIGARSLLTPLKLALQAATREQVAPEMLDLARRIVRGAEAECTLFGAHALCESQVPVGGKSHARDIARLDASLVAARALGASEQLITQATALLSRLRAEVQLEACLVDFKVVGGPIPGSEAPPTEPAKYIFPDGTILDSLLQALEMRSQLVTAAVEAGSAVDGVSGALLEEAANLLKQLKKDIREETKNEEERRRLEEEAALKAAKKGKKKKA